MDTATRPGLRERKKQRTRDALLRRGLELFTTRGYERTTVDEIAEAVDVSQRTFFRYFAGKEDIVFFVQEMVESQYVTEIARRPAEEAPVEAMRQAVMSCWDRIGASIEQLVPVELHLRTYQLIWETPALLAIHLRRSIEWEEKIARILAAREGVDPETDPRPRVAVGLFGGVMRVTERTWSAGGDLTVAAMRDLTTRHLDAIAPALARGW
ncbi:TetR family transcriptional regulator [Streptomyces griseoaurantiacus]|uniref:TetR family transcriptional regulator n=1 Tax=Streptomyces griseoaurantiacus TaxID=68213 RepID=UPI0030E3CB86